MQVEQVSDREEPALDTKDTTNQKHYVTNAFIAVLMASSVGCITLSTPNTTNISFDLHSSSKIVELEENQFLLSHKTPVGEISLFNFQVGNLNNIKYTIVNSSFLQVRRNLDGLVYSIAILGITSILGIASSLLINPQFVPIFIVPGFSALGLSLVRIAGHNELVAFEKQSEQMDRS